MLSHKITVKLFCAALMSETEKFSYKKCPRITKQCALHTQRRMLSGIEPERFV